MSSETNGQIKLVKGKARFRYPVKNPATKVDLEISCHLYGEANVSDTIIIGEYDMEYETLTISTTRHNRPSGEPHGAIFTVKSDNPDSTLLVTGVVNFSNGMGNNTVSSKNLVNGRATFGGTVNSTETRVGYRISLALTYVGGSNWAYADFPSTREWKNGLGGGNGTSLGNTGDGPLYE